MIGRRGRAPTLRCILALCVLLLSPLARAEEEWDFGRTAAVFRPEEEVLTTRIGGWFDASYEDNDLDGSSSSVNLNHFNMFLDTRFGDAWQLFLEGEFENESDLTGFEDEKEWEVEQAYGRHRWGDRLEARLGKFNTPFGFWTPVHWSILMDTIRPPMHESLRITPEQQQGFELRGFWFPGGRPELPGLRYSAYTGYGNDTELLNEMGTDGWSAGADLRLTFGETAFLGGSYYQQPRDLDERRTERNFDLYGQVVLPANLLLRGEWVRQMRDSSTLPGLSRDIDISYVKLRWRFDPRAYVNYRFNWGDDDSAGTTESRHVHTFTLGVQPRPWLRLKLEYAENRFPRSSREDFSYWGASIGSLF